MFFTQIILSVSSMGNTEFTEFQKDILVAIISGVISGLVAFSVAAWQIRKENFRSEKLRRQDKQDADLERRATEKRVLEQMKIQNKNDLGLRRQLYFDQKNLEDHLYIEKKVKKMSYNMGYMQGTIQALGVIKNEIIKQNDKDCKNKSEEISSQKLLNYLISKNKNIYIYINESTMMIDELSHFLDMYYSQNSVCKNVSNLGVHINTVKKTFDQLKINAEETLKSDQFKRILHYCYLEKNDDLSVILKFVDKKRKEVIKKFNNIEN
ncbi:hypothetical protein [Enterococcus sp. DIV1639a]|uniref:hypothetical protein n=1 Tax=Enterococcus sp. DIV1639a TaxID=2774724 RepID=UPI003629B637